MSLQFFQSFVENWEYSVMSLTNILISWSKSSQYASEGGERGKVRKGGCARIKGREKEGRQESGING